MNQKISRYITSLKKFFQQEKNVQLVFDISLALKGIFAALEVFAGIFAYFVSQELLLRIVVVVTHGELVEDPRDLIANFLLHAAQNLSISTQYFTALYLLAHGIIKLFLISGLLRKKLWYYPTALIVFGMFIAYQLYQFSFTHSIWYALITVLDVVVIWLTWHEYNYLRKRLSGKKMARN
ncbi:MAG: DUF2127 domain-containing protein [Patescibacteria group bacterium]